MAAGSIVVDLLARTGSFITDLDRAARRVKSFQKDTLSFRDALRASFFGNLLAGAADELLRSLVRIPAAFSQIIESTARFKDLGEIIGDTGEAVASLQTAADVSGVSIDNIATASAKLSAELAKTDDESKGAAAALKAINVPLEEFKRLSPVQQIDAVSRALAGFRDGAEKTAVAVALFGRAGAQLLPFLKELRNQGGPIVIFSQEQIDLADDFADSQALAGSQLRQFVQAGVLQAVPAINDFSSAARDAAKAVLGIDQATNTLKGNPAVGEFADDAAVFLGRLIDLARLTAKAFQFLGETIGATAAIAATLNEDSLQATTSAFSFDPKGLLDVASRQSNAIAEIVRAAREKGQKEFSSFESFADDVERRINERRKRLVLTGERLTASTDPRSTTFGNALLPKIDTTALVTEGGADDPTKKLLENRIKALESAVQREQSLLGERNRFLDIFNAQGLLSISSYYDAQLAIIEAATTAQTAAINKQIALTTAARDSATKQTDRADQQGKLDALIEKRSRLEQESGLKVIELTIRREEAERRFAQQIETTRASVFELEGSLAKAAAIRFDQQNLDLVRRLSAEGNAEGLKLVETLRKAAIAQAEFAQDEPLRQVNAQLLELRGNLAAAAAIRFDAQNFELVRRLTAQGNEEGLKLVATLRAAAIAQAEFGRASADTQRVIDSLAIAEDRIAISRQLGATTELGALTQLGQARRAALAQLEAQVQAQEAIAKASGNPALVQQAERARVELERLAATADPLADKFRGIFEGGFGDALGDFATGAKTAKEAFNDFANSVADQIARLAAQNLAQSLFGKDGAFGGIGSAFGGLFGGGATEGGGGGAAAAAGLGAVGAAATPTAAGLTEVALAANAAAVALGQVSGGATTASASGGGSGGGLLATFFEFIGGFFAAGGTPPLGKVSVGGELGPELFMPTHSAAVRLKGPALIGADGPQFFRPSVPGIVIPADETARILRDFGGAFAGGGFPPIGRTSLGGEEGLEMFLPVTHGRRPPSNEQSSTRGGPMISQTNNFTIQGPVSRDTEQQIAIKAAQAAQRALARGNA